LKKIKNDILEISSEYKSDVKYHNWIKEIKKTITPNKDKYQKDNLYYDLQCNPQDYLPCMIRMMKEVEKDEVMIYNVFPMRNDLISIDETSVSSLMKRNHCYSEVGKRCVIKTTSQEVFKKYTAIFAINNKGVIGWELYEKEV
jgi:hypothetical protein